MLATVSKFGGGLVNSILWIGLHFFHKLIRSPCLQFQIIFKATFVRLRVTRLGEFSTFWATVFFGQIQKLPKFSGYFFHGKRCVLILTKNGFGHVLGDFLTNSSGHPGFDRRFRKKSEEIRRLAEREKKPQRVLKRQKQTTYAVRRLSKA
jgi:hypothetical protein